MKIDAALQLDGYKTGHREQYPPGTELVYSNLTARGSRVPDIDATVFFGLQYYIKEYLIRQWNDSFFLLPEKEAVANYARVLDQYCPQESYEHIAELHRLGYLPVEIRAVKEGTEVPLRTPMLTIHNTDPRFFWVTNMLETSMSNILWMPITAATIANDYRNRFDRYAEKTCDNNELVPWQGHDFSYRGTAGLEAACLIGAGHLTSFYGTDTIPSLPFVEQYYGGADPLIGGSVSASEHSVSCAGGEHGEEETFRRFLEDLYPKGIFSFVCDTWDFWGFLTETVPKFKQEILARDGKAVLRPDSGDPVKIICGDADRPEGTPQRKGAIEVLWEIFGGTVNSKGFKELDPHIGLIYGDSITRERQKEILARLEEKGFASSNIVLGIGSFTYSFNTRDTFGMAVKATYVEVEGESRNIFKNPKTDDGTKKSMKGLLSVDQDFNTKQECTWDETRDSILSPVFRDGKLIREETFDEIRSRLR